MRNVLIWLHIVSGAVSLLTGTWLLIRRKGDRTHRKVGLGFYFSMLLVAFSALALAFIRPNSFLAVIGVFTLYMNVTGKRYVRASRTKSPAKSFDWLLSFFMMCFGVVLLYTGLRSVTDSDSFGIVSVVFGIISLLMVAADFKNYRSGTLPVTKCLSMHLQRMCGAYIAAVTAFLVVNFPQGLISPSMAFVPWLIPTLVVTPFIVSWSRKYTRQGVKM